MRSYTELNDQHLDVLKEIGNIGAGNAATSLGVLIDESVSISIPNVRIEEFDNVIRSVGGPEEMVISVLVNFYGDANGVVLFLLSMQDAKGITSILIGEEDEDDTFLSEMKISVIKEIGNILGSSYLGSIATLTGMTLNISVPHIAVDMVGAILAAPVIEYGAADTKVMFIEESFSTDVRKLSSSVIMFADMVSLKEIMNRLGLDL